MYKNCLYGGTIPEDLTIGVGSLGEFFVKRIKDLYDTPLLIDFITGKEVFASQLLSRSIYFAESLRKHNIRKGDRVAIISNNSVEHSYIYFGCILLGAVIAPLITGYTEGEIVYLCNITTPKIIFSSVELLDKVLNASKQIPSIKKIIVLGDNGRCENFQTFLNENKYKVKSVFHCKPVDIKTTSLIVLLSAGTTGRAKAAELTQQTLFSYLTLVKYGNEADYQTTMSSYAYLTGSFYLFSWILKGQKGVVIPLTTEENFFKCIEIQTTYIIWKKQEWKYKICFQYLSPATLHCLLDSPLLGKYDISSLSLVITGSSVVSEDLIKDVKEKMGVENVFRLYGMTEGIGCIMQPFDKKPVKNSIGIVRPGVWAKVVDPDSGTVNGPNKEGEIMIKSDRILKGYFNDPESSKNVFDADGFLHTGDIGYYDNSGNWFFVERIKEIIIYMDTHVYPSVIESIIRKYPHVKDVCVVGVPDEKAGELATAFVVADSGSGGTLTEKEIFDFVAKQVSQTNQLHGGVRFILEIPRNANGKPLKRVLKKMAH